MPELLAAEMGITPVIPEIVEAVRVPKQKKMIKRIYDPEFVNMPLSEIYKAYKKTRITEIKPGEYNTLEASKLTGVQRPYILLLCRIGAIDCSKRAWRGRYAYSISEKGINEINKLAKEGRF